MRNPKPSGTEKKFEHGHYRTESGQLRLVQTRVVFEYGYNRKQVAVGTGEGWPAMPVGSMEHGRTVAEREARSVGELRYTYIGLGKMPQIVGLAQDVQLEEVRKEGAE